MVPSRSTTPAPAPRPSSRGSFEVHVQSVRATRAEALSHLVQPTPITRSSSTRASPPQYIISSLPSYGGKRSFDSHDEKKESEITVESARGSPVPVILKDEKSNRRTSDDGPEPKTLARSLFFYGFVFPLFWLVGACILFADLRYHQTAEEMAEDSRTPEERVADLKVLRAAEVRWAFYSFYAITLLVLAVVIALLVWASVTGRFTGMHTAP
ncbi:hypothetical protein DL93DRAFT_2070477 [Clavulina sp. PMI_390]|nr:hypothetical protein DL93DRAFT_2070477 [Clavulina sp. PMI_390]